MGLTERRFEAAMEYAAIGTAIVGLEGQWLWSNRALCKLLGYPARELKGKTFQDVTHPDDLDADVAHLARLVAGRQAAYQMEKRYIRRDGSLVWCQLNVSLVRADDGEPLYFISQVQDITQARADMAERSILAERLMLATRAGGIGVWEWDLDTNILIWDDRMFEMYGMDSAAGVTLADFEAAVQPEDLDRVRSSIEAAKAGKRPYDIQFRIGRGEAMRHIQGLATIVRRPDGAPARMIGTNWDITEKRLLLERAQAASTAKSHFLAAMSHEIRTPLNGVMGMTQALAADNLSPSQLARVRTIHESADTLLTILNDILDLSKVEAGKVEIEAAPFALGALLKGEQATFAAIAHEKGLDFRCDLEDVGGVYTGDPTRLRQVLRNLLSNAMKFTAAGSVRLIALRTPDGIELTVSDTGIGIAEAVQERIFTPFTQADVSTTRTHGGTGLGLSICKHLTELMGGDICLESRPGVGTTIRVTLPLLRSGDEPEEQPALQGRAQPDARSLRVLVAEDNEVNQLVLRALLDQAGITPHIVGDGRAVIEAWAEDHGWDLILMDVRMPVMDGIAAARAIREAEAQSGRVRTPIIALTANAMSHHVLECAEAGMDDFVAKPIEARALFAALERAAAAAEQGVGQAA